MVLTFRNAHNLNSAARTSLNRAVFAALKPGGIYGVVDHTKRHMQGIKKWTWRRSDPVQIIHEAILAGFEFVDYSDIHARPEDELLYDTRHDSLINETDRFTLKFRKPK
jgi:predicted methyltransferase